MRQTDQSRRGQEVRGLESPQSTGVRESTLAANLRLLAETLRDGGHSCLSPSAIKRHDPSPSDGLQPGFLGTLRIGERLEHRYQVELLLRAAGAKITYGQLADTLKADSEPTKVIEINVGETVFQLVLDREGDLSAAAVSVASSCEKALNTAAQMMADADHARSMGEHFAKSILESNQTGDLSQRVQDPERIVSIGTFTLTEADRFAALATFIERTTSLFCSTVRDVNMDTLDSIVAHLPDRAVHRLKECVEVSSYTHLLNISEDKSGGCVVELKLDRLGLSRDKDMWFASSDVAREIGEAFDSLGVHSAVPRLAKLLSEVDVDINLGNGFASLSRRMMHALFQPEDSDSPKLRALTACAQFRDRLSDLHAGAKHVASKHMLGLLKALGPVEADAPRAVAADPPLPNFRSFGIGAGTTSCADAEGYFVMAVRSAQFTQDPYFLYKEMGQPTALSKTEICVDGVVVPPGTLCHVSKGVDGEIVAVRPVRLTMFSLPYAEAIEVLRPHYEKMRHHAGDNDVHLHQTYLKLVTPFEAQPHPQPTSLVRWAIQRLLRLRNTGVLKLSWGANS